MLALVVDDDPVMRLLLEASLQECGHDVTTVADAEAALEAYRRDRHPLVLLDWVLIGDSGLDLCRNLRSLPHGDQSIILMVTAMNRPEHLQQALAAGANDYITKPLDLERLRIRLTIAERRAAKLAKLAEARTQLRRSHDDMKRILDGLRIGTAITDADGSVSFLSRAAAALFDVDAANSQGLPWERVFTLADDKLRLLRAMCAHPPETRTRVGATSTDSTGQRHQVEIEVQDDPAQPERKIFSVYDVSELYDLRSKLEGRTGYEGLIGQTEAMRGVFQLIDEVARVNTTVLIQGETGTGKELVARAIHNKSARSNGPFVTVNSAGLTESLIASQLFGHRRGAFTGAVDNQKGLFEAADGGTLFLDEIGDIPPGVQASLLRVLQEWEITRVGESRPRKVDVRVLAATHRDLEQMVAEGRFRADLLYRIRVTRIALPPLRERREDIPLLVSTFIARKRADTGSEVENISADAMQMLMAHGWPGNVRELESAIVFAMVRAHGTIISPEDLPPELLQAPAVAPSPAATEPLDEKARLIDALDRAGGRRTQAAKLLGMSRATFYRKLARHGVRLDK